MNYLISDSKTLKESDRDEIFQKINDSKTIGWVIDILSPNFISNSMLKRLFSKFCSNTKY